MKDYGDDDYLHARIYVMRGRLFSLRDYTLMARNPESFTDKRSGEFNPVDAKEAVFKEQLSGVISLAEATRKYAPLFLAFLRQYEASNAKIILAKAFGRESLEQWYDIGPYAILEKNLLQKELAPDDIRMLLAGSYLSDVLEDISSYERMEIRVDLCIARDLYTSSSAFLPEDRKAFQDLMLRRVAVMAVIWQRRLREGYGWGEERIRNYLENLLEGLNGRVWPQIRLVQESLEGRLEQMRKSGGQLPTVADVERHLEQYYFRWISTMFHRDFHSIHCVAAYLWLLYYQVRNLFRIIEGRRFGLSPDAVLEGIICEA
jgi:vacuolar-type H+-ATPase subunit C/Vma6